MKQTFRRSISILDKDDIAIRETLGRFIKKRSKDIESFFYGDVKRFLSKLNKLEDITNDNRRKARSLFRKECDDIIKKGEILVADIKDGSLKKAIKQVFRKLLEPRYESNPFIKRGLEKPRGYAGDYMMMEMGYKKETASGNGLEGEFDLYFFERYQCILNRKEIIKNYLRKAIQCNQKEILQVLTLGGGPSREWMELDRELSRLKPKIALSYLDQDREALQFSQRRLQKLDILKKLEFFDESLLGFRNSSRWSRRKEDFDFVYALGIADYFPDSFLTDVCHRALELVRRHGKFLITHKNKEKFSFPLLDWLCDWNFVHRNETEFRRIVTEALRTMQGTFHVEIERDDTGEVIFILVTKK